MPKLIFKSRFFRHSAMMGSLLLLAPLLGMVIFAQYPETPTTESLSETVTTAPVNNPLAHGGPTLFVSDLGGIDVYDHTNGDYLGKFGDTSGENLLGLVFHPVTGNLLAGHSDGYIAEYDGETCALIGTFGDAADPSRVFLAEEFGGRTLRAIPGEFWHQYALRQQQFASLKK